MANKNKNRNKNHSSGQNKNIPSAADRKENQEMSKDKAVAAAALEVAKEELEKTTPEMNDNMKNLLSSDMKEMERKDKTRGAEILAVFAKHNFYHGGLTPEELRTTLEDLGPTYVKIGQIMSSRVDMLPEAYCSELEKLRQNVQQLDPKIARAVIEQETGRKIEDIFSEFRDKPLGSASVGQAHYGVLKDGTKVVVKVQRPLIADMMRKDFVMLKKLAGLFNVVTEGDDGGEAIDLVEVIDEFEKVTEEELDFRVEAANTKFFRENCVEDPEKVCCPTVIDDLTTERIFTMTFVDGYSIAKKERLIEEGYDPLVIGRNLIENYAHQVLDVGVFHADPHQGNIMVSKGTAVWIDFGMIGRLSSGDIGLIQSMVLSVIGKDAEGLANAIMSMGGSSSKTNRDKLILDLDVFLDRYCAVSSLEDLDMSRLFNEVTDLANKHSVKMPGRFTMLVRSLATIEGVVEQFCPEINLFSIISHKMMENAQSSFNLENSLLAAGKDVLELGKKAARIPTLIADVLAGLSRGRTKINLELTGYEELLESGSKALRTFVLTIFACVIFIGACLLCMSNLQPKAPGGIPAIAAMALVFSISLGIYVVKSLSKK